MKAKKKDKQMQKMMKERNNHIMFLREEVDNFYKHQYYKEIDKFFDSLNISFKDRLSAYSTLVIFAFIFNVEKQVFTTHYKNEKEHELLIKLKDIIPAEKLIFEYKEEIE